MHKETLNQVDNALPNRQSLDVEIFGMEGIPHEALEQHRSRIIQHFYQAQEDRRIATGNPVSGQPTQRKKIKIETEEELLKRLAEFRANKKAGIPNGGQDAAQVGDARAGQQQVVCVYPLVLPSNELLMNFFFWEFSRATRLMQSRRLPSLANNRMRTPVPNLFLPGLRAFPSVGLACLRDRPRLGTGLIQVCLVHRVTT